MEKNWNYALLSILISFMSLVWHLSRKTDYNFRTKLPPGPKGWPVIGNIFDIGRLPHRSLAALKQEYGPVVWLNLGSVKTMVILSAGAAEELFKNHDLSFIDRNIVETMRSHDFYKSSIGLISYCSYWRTLRRICAIELFTKKKIIETKLIRRKCVDDMLLWIEMEAKKCASSGIEVTKFVFPALFNMMGNLVLSRDLVDPYSRTASEFYLAMTEFLECLGSPNVSDLFPWIRWLDLQGLRRRSNRDLGKTLEISSGFVKERLEERKHKKGRSSNERKDFLDVLLDFEGTGKDEPANLTERQVTIFVMEMFIGGTESMNTTIEWAMCELLQNPEAMMKIKAELARFAGSNKKLEENDVDNLHYLRATVDETLRLHPPLPLLVPRKAIRDTNFMGYTIPKDTQVFVNTWAIQKDEENWEDALSFKPERFLDSNIGFKGLNFEFLPFGAGRRICPGLPLVENMMPLILASLLHHFDWELCENATIIDMTETMGIAVGKLEHLKAVPKRSM